jgi:hypothetical protein
MGRRRLIAHQQIRRGMTSRPLLMVALALLLMLAGTTYLVTTYHAGQALNDELAVLAHAR